ncbi:MAG: gliding-motility protein MglA, partial [Flexistipes sinusarabici]
QGKGVFDTLKGVAKDVIKKIKG